MALPNGDLITTPFDPQMAYPSDRRMQVDTLNSRDSMSMFIRWEGMEVYVLENKTKYILQGGRSNEFWKESGTGTGTGGTTFVGQFPTSDLLPTSGRSAGDYAFVGTGDDFVQYNWDNIANEWVMAEGQTDMASEFFHIGYKTPLRRPVIFPLFPKDVLVETSGDFVFAPVTDVARFIFVGEVDAIRGIETAAADREIKLVNRTGSDIPLRDKASGIPSGSGMDFGGTDYTWVNGSEITLKGNGTYWELAPNNQVAFSDHLDSVNAQVSVGSDGLEVIAGIYDRTTGEYISFKEVTGTPTPDGVLFVNYKGKYFKRSFTGPVNILWYGAKGDNNTDNFSNINQAIQSAGEYGKILIPEGVFCVSDRLLPLKGQEIDFQGWLKLKAPDTVISTVMTIQASEVVLRNPLLDMDMDNVLHDTNTGTQAVLSQGRFSTGLRVYGGILKNGVHNIFQGGGSDTTFYGTIMSNCGEHIVYLNSSSTAKNITFDKCTLKDPAQDGDWSEGHYFQIRNYSNVNIIGCVGYGGSNLIPVSALNITNSKNIKVNGSEFSEVNHFFVISDETSENVSIESTDFIKDVPNLKGSGITNTRSLNTYFSRCNFIDGDINSYQPSAGYIDCHFTVRNEILPLSTLKLTNCDIYFSQTASRIANLTNAGMVAKNVTIDFGGRSSTSSVGIAHQYTGEILDVDGLEIKGYVGPNAIGIYQGSGHRLRKVKIKDNSSTSSIRVFSGVTDVIIDEPDLLGGINLSEETSTLIYGGTYNTQTTFNQGLRKINNAYYEWVDANGRKRINNGKPANLSSGIVQGSDYFISFIGASHTLTDGVNLTGTPNVHAITQISIRENNGIVNGFPSDNGTCITFNGSTFFRTWSVWKNTSGIGLWMQYYNGSGVGQGWVRVDSTSSTVLSATATLDFPVIAAGETERLTATVTGAALLDPVLVSGPDNIYNSNDSTIDAWVSAANTVTVRVRNNGASSIDPGSGDFKIKVFK